MGDTAERIVLEVDEQPAVEAVSRANASVQGFEKKYEQSGAKLVRISDNTRSSVQRLIASLEKQAEVYGKTGVDRLIAQRDQLLQRYQREPQAIDAITKSYERMLAEEKKLSGGSGFNARYAFFGIKDLAEGRTKFAVAELGNELIRLNGTALGIGIVATVIAGIGIAAYEVTQRMEKLREANEKLHGEFERLRDGNHLENAELELSNTKLTNIIAKLEHKPGNGLKEGLEEAAVAAVKLSEKLDGSIGKFYELLKKTETAGLMQIFAPSDKDLSEMVGGKSGFGGFRGELYKVMRTGGDPTAVLAKYRAQAQKELSAAQYSLAHPQTAVQRAMVGALYGTQAVGAIGVLPGAVVGAAIPNQDLSGRIEKFTAYIDEIDKAGQFYGLEKTHGALIEREKIVRESVEADKREGELFRQRMEFIRRTDRWLEEQSMKRDNLEVGIRYGEENLKAMKGREELGQIFADSKSALALTLPDRLIGAPSGYQSIEQIKALAEHNARMAGINARPGEQFSAAGQEANDRLAMIKAVYDQEVGILDVNRDALKIAADKAKADLDSVKVRYEYEEKIAGLQKKQFEEIAKSATGLWNTLLTNPRGFGKQFSGTIRGAFLHPVTEGLGNMTTNLLHPLLFGKDGTGGLAALFGGKQDPIKLATDQNTMATVQNTSALASVSLALFSLFSGVGIPGTASARSLSPLELVARANTIWRGATAPASSHFDSSSYYAAGSPTENPINMGGYALGMGLSGISVPRSLLAGGSSASPMQAASVSSTIDYGSGPQNFGQQIYAGGGSVVGDALTGDFSGFAGSPGSLPGFAGPVSSLRLPARGGGGLPGVFKLPTSLSGLKDSFWNEDIYSAPGVAHAAGGSFGGNLQGVLTSKGSASLMIAGGVPLAMAGIAGGRRGTLGGMAESTLGGALTGAGIGTMILPGIGTAIGAGIGALVGFGISAGEMIFGVESPQAEAARLVKSVYGVSVSQNSGIIKQIVSIAQQQFGGTISVAVRSPSVRQLVMLYSEATGQKMPMSAATPYAGSLQEQGGKLYQQATWTNNQMGAYSSNLPTLGGYSPNLYPNSQGPTYLSMNVSGQGVAQFMTGAYMTPQFVTDQSMAAQNVGYGRTQMSANLQAPGLTVGP